MKQLINLSILLICLFLTISCEMDEISCIRVDGPIESQKRTLDEFNSVFFGDVGNLHITQGNEHKLILKGQKAILDKLKTSNNDGELIISLDECFNGDNYSLDIFVTASDFKKIEMSGVGFVKTESKIIADVFTLILSGASEANEIEIEADSISTYLLGTGDLTYSGSSRSHSILLSGTSSLNAYSLLADDTHITSNGIGNIYVQTDENLNATLNNIGDVYYKGSPQINKSENNLGKVIDGN